MVHRNLGPHFQYLDQSEKEIEKLFTNMDP